MSKDTTRQITLKTKDETVPLLLAISREMRSTSREIHFLEMAYYALEDAETAAAAGELTLIDIAQLAIPVIGVFASMISMLAGAQLISQRGAGIIPVAQTAPGQFRMVQSTGPALLHAGEVVSRPMVAGGRWRRNQH